MTTEELLIQLIEEVKEVNIKLGLMLGDVLDMQTKKDEVITKLNYIKK